MQSSARVRFRSHLLLLSLGIMLSVSGCLGGNSLAPSPSNNAEALKTAETFFSTFSGPDEGTLRAITTPNFVGILEGQRFDLDEFIHELSTFDGSLAFTPDGTEAFLTPGQGAVIIRGFGYLETVDQTIELEVADGAYIVPTSRVGYDFSVQLRKDGEKWRVNEFSLALPFSRQGDPAAPSLDLALYPNRILKPGEKFALCLTLTNSGGPGSYRIGWSLNNEQQYEDKVSYKLEESFEAFPFQFYDDTSPCLIQQAVDPGIYTYTITLLYGHGDSSDLELTVSESLDVTVQ